MNYDYIIIGLNPSGLTIAYYLSKMNKNVLLVENNQNLNNSCIYSDSFVNLINLIKDEFKSDFYELFNPIEFNSDKIFKLEENIFFDQFLLKLFNNKVSDLTIEKFIDHYKFNCPINCINQINLICKMMLKKDYSNTYVNEYIDLLDKEIIYKFYQPPELNHDKLYNIWLQNIYNTKNCVILFNSIIGKINIKNNMAESIQINNEIIYGNNIIFCINFPKITNNLKYKNFQNIHIINNNNNYDYVEQSIIKAKKLIYKLEKNNCSLFNISLTIYKSDNLTDIIKFIFVLKFILLLFNYE